MSVAAAARGASRRFRLGDESGHLMAGLMAIVAIMLIFSTIVFQAWEDVLRRDNEAEMIFRAQEIARAIQRYRLDNQNVPPPSLENLAEPGNRGQYYLRREYEDPLVADGKWGLVFAGPDGSIIDPSGNVDPQRQLGFDEQRDSLANQVDRQRDRFVRGGGQRIAGVKTKATDKPFRVYKGFSDYSQWLFTYHDYELGAAGQTGVQRPGQGRGTRPGQPGQPGSIGQPGAFDRRGQSGSSGGAGQRRPDRRRNSGGR